MTSACGLRVPPPLPSLPFSSVSLSETEPHHVPLAGLELAVYISSWPSTYRDPSAPAC